MTTDVVWWHTAYGRRAVRNTLLAETCDAYVGLPVDAGYMDRQVSVTRPFLGVGYAIMTPPSVSFARLDDLKPHRVAVEFRTPPQSLLATREGFSVSTYRSAEAPVDAAARKGGGAAGRIAGARDVGCAGRVRVGGGRDVNDAGAGHRRRRPGRLQSTLLALSLTERAQSRAGARPATSAHPLRRPNERGVLRDDHRGSERQGDAAVERDPQGGRHRADLELPRIGAVDALTRRQGT